MGRFASVGRAQVFKNGNYFPCLSAEYRVRILETKANRSRKGALAFIVDVEVLEVRVRPEEKADREGRTVPPVGDKRSWYVSLDIDAGPGNMRGFIELTTGEDLGNMTEAEYEEFCEMYVSEEQPVRGMELILRTYNKPTQKGGNFTAHEWSLAS